MEKKETNESQCDEENNSCIHLSFELELGKYEALIAIITIVVLVYIFSR